MSLLRHHIIEERFRAMQIIDCTFPLHLNPVNGLRSYVYVLLSRSSEETIIQQKVGDLRNFLSIRFSQSDHFDLVHFKNKVSHTRR